jgi:hypothetical protein
LILLLFAKVAIFDIFLISPFHYFTISFFTTFVGSFSKPISHEKVIHPVVPAPGDYAYAMQAKRKFRPA